MGRYKRKNAFLSFIVFVLVFAGAIGLISYFIRSQAFTVRLNGQALSATQGGFDLLKGETYDFAVLNADTESNPDGAYTVKIVPYNKDSKTDFRYIVGNEWKQYSKETNDLTEYFTITQNEKGFTLFVENDINDILKQIHIGKYYSIANNVVNSTADYFLLTISLADGSKTVSIYFRIGYPLRLDKEHLEF